MAKAPRGMFTKLVLEYFKAHPNEEIEHAPVVDWVTEKVVKAGYDPPRDVWRIVRHFHEKGVFIKVAKGVFKYDPNHEPETELLEFPEKIKQAIFKRDNFRCVVCNLGEEDGVSIAVDHKTPKSLGGENTLQNGQTLCYKHNSMKKNYSQTEAGKRYFIEIYETAVKNQDVKMIAFCETVFDVYDAHDVNGHIDRPDAKNSV